MAYSAGGGSDAGKRGKNQAHGHSGRRPSRRRSVRNAPFSGVAVVTGASSGLGREIVRLLPPECPVVLTGRNAVALEAVAVERNETSAATSGGARIGAGVASTAPAVVVAGDLADRDTVERLLAAADRLGGASLLVNAAGSGAFGAIVDTPVEQTLDANRANVLAFTAVTARFAARMRDAGCGVICTIASVAALFPGPLMAGYYAAKAYQFSYAVALDRELAGSGVRSIVVCPGPFRSSFHDRAGLDAATLYSAGAVPTAARIARFTLRAIERRRAIAVPGAILPVVLRFQALVPRRLMARIVHRLQSRRPPSLEA